MNRDSSVSDARNVSSAYVWYVVGLLALVNAVNYMDRMALAALAPSIKVDLALSDGELGLLIGFAFALFYALCGIFIARWADRGVRRNILVLALVVWSAMTALSGAARNFWHLFAARVGVGAGEAGCFPSGHSMLCDYVPLERRPVAFAVNQVGISAGILFGMALAGWLGETIGWRWTFVALGFPGIVLAALVWLTLREPERGRFDAVKQVSVSMGRTIGVLWRCRTYRLLAMEFAARAFAVQGLAMWWPSFYARIHGLGLASGGLSVGLAFGLGGIAGVLFGGVIANWAARRDVRLPLRICVGTVLLALPAAIASLLIPSLAASLVLASLTIVLATIPSGPALASLYSVVSAPMRATAGAVAFFILSLVGFGLGPFCVGMLSDLLSPSLGNGSLRYALFAPVCILPLVALLLHAASKYLPGDLRATGSQAAQ